jgi:flagellar hook assembly protein FlgD
MLVTCLVATPTQAPGSAAVPLLIKESRVVYLSPNGDGRADRARVAFRLTEPATVKIRVHTWAPRHRVRGPVVKRFAAGRHVWRWNGRNDNGRPVPDGRYVVSLTARQPDGTTSGIQVHAFMDRDGNQGVLRTSRPTVYPQASIVEDRVQFLYLREGWTPADASDPQGMAAVYGPRMALRLRVSVTDAAGQRVWRQTRRGGVTTTFSWDGRTSDGVVAPAGVYTARLLVTDGALNRTSYRASVEVSHEQLRLDTWTTTLDAAAATIFNRPTPAGCNGCGYFCGPAESQRFPGGLHFRECFDFSASGADFAVPVPFSAAPVDTYRVTATGGPPTDGGTGSGGLSGQGMGPGDAIATTAWFDVHPEAYPYLPDQDLAPTWSFTASSSKDDPGTTTSYDLASFTVEYRRYVPVP